MGNFICSRRPALMDCTWDFARMPKCYFFNYVGEVGLSGFSKDSPYQQFICAREFQADPISIGQQKKLHWNSTLSYVNTCWALYYMCKRTAFLLNVSIFCQTDELCVLEASTIQNKSMKTISSSDWECPVKIKQTGQAIRKRGSNLPFLERHFYIILFGKCSEFIEITICPKDPLKLPSFLVNILMTFDCRM